MQIHVNNTGENRLFLSIIHILKLLYAVYISAILLAFPSDMSRNSTTLEALLLVLICLLLLCAQRGQSKKYMRCELTRVMVQNYKFQKTLMSNCELKIPNFLYMPYNTFLFAKGSAWWSTRARWTPTRLPGKRTIARTMVCFRSIARTTVPRDARGVFAI